MNLTFEKSVFDRFKYLRHNCLKYTSSCFDIWKCRARTTNFYSIGMYIVWPYQLGTPLFLPIRDRLCQYYSCWYHSANHEQGTCNQNKYLKPIKNKFKSYRQSNCLAYIFNSFRCLNKVPCVTYLYQDTWLISSRELKKLFS